MPGRRRRISFREKPRSAPSTRTYSIPVSSRSNPRPSSRSGAILPAATTRPLVFPRDRGGHPPRGPRAWRGYHRVRRPFTRPDWRPLVGGAVAREGGHPQLPSPLPRRQPPTEPGAGGSPARGGRLEGGDRRGGRDRLGPLARRRHRAPRRGQAPRPVVGGSRSARPRVDAAGHRAAGEGRPAGRRGRGPLRRPPDEHPRQRTSLRAARATRLRRTGGRLGRMRPRPPA